MPHVFNIRCLCSVDLILTMATRILILSTQLVEVSRKAIMEPKERAMEAEGKLCEALAHASEVELAFREERDWMNALSRSSVHATIKLGEMRLRVTEA